MADKMDVENFFGSLDAEVAKMFRYWNIDVKPEESMDFHLENGILYVIDFKKSDFYLLQKTDLNVVSLEELYYNLHYFFLIKDDHLDVKWKKYEEYVHHFGVIITILIDKLEQCIDVNKVKKNDIDIDVLEARKIMRYNINIVQYLLTQEKYLINYKCFNTMKIMNELSEIIDF